jgi:hypothetical protein
MLDLSKPEELAVYREAEQAARNMQGTNFALIMRQGDSLKLYRRETQPCQGGEMRKYAKISYPPADQGKVLHEDCTRPDDPRPSDLKHPFPDGIPELVAVHFQKEMPERMFEDLYVYGPYSKLNGKIVEVIDEWSGLVCGCLIDTEIDSTLLVNFLQFVRSCNVNAWKAWCELGAQTDEIASLMYLTNPGFDVRMSAPAPYNYYFSTNTCVKRVLEGSFNDLTGGTFRDRFDYNRPEIQDLYKFRDGETKTNFCQELSKRHKWSNPNYGEQDPETGRTELKNCQDDLLDICREIIREAVSAEEKRLSESKVEEAA